MNLNFKKLFSIIFGLQFTAGEAVTGRSQGKHLQLHLELAEHSAGISSTSLISSDLADFL